MDGTWDLMRWDLGRKGVGPGTNEPPFPPPLKWLHKYPNVCFVYRKFSQTQVNNDNYDGQVKLCFTKKQQFMSKGLTYYLTIIIIWVRIRPPGGGKLLI